MTASRDITFDRGMVSDYALARLADGDRGVVRGVYRSSLNVQTPGLLLHVGGMGEQLSCLGMGIGTLQLHDLLSKSRTGDAVVFRDGALRIYDALGVSVVRYDALEVVSCKIKTVSRCALQPIPSLLRDLGLTSRTGLADERQLGEIALTLADEAVTEDDLVRCVDYLLGRGPGLTPSGDDLLVGYGVGMWMLERQHPFVDVVARAPRGGRTTDVSRAYLDAMVDGYANRGYCELGDALTEGNGELLPRILNELLYVGHTSGADGLLGFALALEFLG